MNYRDYLQDLKAPKSVYLLYGKERYLINFLVEETKKRFIAKEFESLNYIFFDGNNTNVNDIINASETLPFMADKKIVIVEDFELLVKKQKESDKAEEELLNYIEKPNKQSILIFVQNIEKLDGRRKIIKSLKKYAEVVELNKLTDREIIAWIEKYLREHKKKINRRNIEIIVEYTGYFDNDADMNLMSLENELKKLINYTEDREEITKEDIEKVLTKSLQSNIFSLIDRIGERNIRASVENLENMLKTGGVIPVILHMIAKQFRMIYLTKLYLNEGYSQTMIKNKMNIRYDFIMNKLVNQSRNFTIENLKNIINDCAELDYELKTSKIDENMGIEKLIINMDRYK